MFFFFCFVAQRLRVLHKNVFVYLSWLGHFILVQLLGSPHRAAHARSTLPLLVLFGLVVAVLPSLLPWPAVPQTCPVLHNRHFHINHAHFAVLSCCTIVVENQTREKFCPDDGLRKQRCHLALAVLCACDSIYRVDAGALGGDGCSGSPDHGAAQKLGGCQS